MVDRLFQSTINSNSYGTSLTVTGSGGFGKTSIVTALCHHHVIKEQFKDGVVFIELGPQATDPSMKLSQLYHLLTGEYLKQGDINHAEQEINQLTRIYCHNLLVIIDDVWHVEDAEPIVKAFSYCKIVLTTRMNDIEQYIPSKQVVSIGPMEQSEAISLLTSGVIDISQLSQEDVNTLDELAQDVHLWPLLLSLVRGQLNQNMKQHGFNSHRAIQFVRAKLQDKGLTAFDRNNIGKSRKYAVRVCINVTLDLLSQALSDKLKALILWTGLGTALQTAALHGLWSITEHKASEITDELRSYGVIQFTDIIVPPTNFIKHCVEVHSIISHFIVENMDSTELYRLAPQQDKAEAVFKAIEAVCNNHNAPDGTEAEITPEKELQNIMTDLEYYKLPFSMWNIKMTTLRDPHHIICSLQMFHTLVTKTCITNFLPMLEAQINTLIDHCKKLLKDIYRLSRTLTQSVQRYLSEGRYHSILQTIQKYVKAYPTYSIASQAIAVIEDVIPYFEGEIQSYFITVYQSIQQVLPDFHCFSTNVLPVVTLCTNEMDRIKTSLLAGSPDIEITYNDYMSGKFMEEYSVALQNDIRKQIKIASNINFDQFK